ncbi:hypothetical protein IE53DRAFT_217682 [Violaceomyces palustris]|uniref:Uncharacterized protein n=1 Tax=Violaceomyces palustris TaxID=1673888 RepID=A0ACD0NQE5_9BASI|nr:hypothetical protein IE53DRAFT_217682 [Violaceomyces palustris]
MSGVDGNRVTEAEPSVAVVLPPTSVGTVVELLESRGREGVTVVPSTTLDKVELEIETEVPLSVGEVELVDWSVGMVVPSTTPARGRVGDRDWGVARGRVGCRGGRVVRLQGGWNPPPRKSTRMGREGFQPGRSGRWSGEIPPLPSSTEGEKPPPVPWRSGSEPKSPGRSKEPWKTLCCSSCQVSTLPSWRNEKKRMTVILLAFLLGRGGRGFGGKTSSVPLCQVSPSSGDRTKRRERDL